MGCKVIIFFFLSMHTKISIAPQLRQSNWLIIMVYAEYERLTAAACPRNISLCQTEFVCCNKAFLIFMHF